MRLRSLPLIAVCILSLSVVHLWAVEGNTDPLEMKSIDGPAAALVGTEVTFTASPSGGVGEYKFQWIIEIGRAHV